MHKFSFFFFPFSLKSVLLGPLTHHVLSGPFAASSLRAAGAFLRRTGNLRAGPVTQFGPGPTRFHRGRLLQALPLRWTFFP